MTAPRPGSATILIIDDEMVREMVAALLHTEGRRVLTASSGADGLANARALRPDLILVDHHMPGMTGLEVVKRLKADSKTSRTPIVALTTAGAEEATELIRAGCVAFIPKPLDPPEFRRLIADIIRATLGRASAD